MKKILIYIFGLLNIFCLTQTTFSINVDLPRAQGNQDIHVIGPEKIEGDESSFFETIQLINKYLRFSLGAVCMGLLIYGGISLITSSGDENKMKQTNKLLMGALIGILISVLSYSVVKLVVNLF